MIMHSKYFFILFFITIIGILTGLLFYNILVHGPGVTPDSIAYMRAAKSFLSGNGFYVGENPLTHFPPFYSFLLAICSYFYNGDLVQAGRLLSSLFYGSNIILLGVIIFICTESLTAVATAMLFFLSSSTILLNHAYALSEPPFITILLFSVILLYFFIRDQSIFLLVILASIAGLATLTRYIGVTLIPPILLIIYIFSSKNYKIKLKYIVIATIIAFIPFFIWLVRNIMLAGSATNRVIVPHIVGWKKFKSFFGVITNFILPFEISIWLKLILIVIILFLLIFAITKLFKNCSSPKNLTLPNCNISAFCLLFFVTYTIFLIISISFFDAHTPLDNRLLLPVLLILFIFIFSITWSLTRSDRKIYFWYTFLLYMVFIIFINANHIPQHIVEIYHTGLSYNTIKWKKSSTIDFLANNFLEKKIFTNGVDILWFLLERDSSGIPAKMNPNTRITNETFDNDMHNVVEEIKTGKAIIVYFNNITWRWYLPSIEEIISKWNLRILQRLDDGYIVGIE